MSKVSKIPVQLLKDFAGLGTRGEIVQVTPGRMRNELHINNGAAYVIKGEPLRIRLKTREEVEKARQAALEVQRQEKASRDQLLKTQAREKAKLAEETRFRKLTNLQFGGPSTASTSPNTTNPSSSSSSAFLVESAIRMLPQVINVKIPTKDGSLLYTITDACKHVSELTGTEIPASIAKFSVRTGKNEDKFSSHVDHIGRYRLIFDIPNSSSLSYNIVLTPQTPLPDSVPTMRPYGPLKDLPVDVSAATQDKVETKASNSTDTGSSPKSSSSQQAKKFEWENDLLRDLD